jgi:hypothetical protein
LGEPFFLAQAAASALIILVFWLAYVGAGIDVRFLSEPSLGALFGAAFPIDNSAHLAKAWFDSVFVPLTLLYAMSLSVFAVALISSVGALVRQASKQTLLMAGIVLFLLGLFLIFFVGGSPGSRSLQKYIIEGNAWGYVVLFVFLPIFGVFLAAELPNER